VWAGVGAVALDTSAGTPVSVGKDPVILMSSSSTRLPIAEGRGSVSEAPQPRGGVRPAATSILASCACTRSSEATARRRAGRRRPAFRRARADARRPARCHAGDPSRLGWPAAATPLAVCRGDDGRSHPLAFASSTFPDLAALHASNCRGSCGAGRLSWILWSRPTVMSAAVAGTTSSATSISADRKPARLPQRG
jgi:hypothetical protein